MKKTLFSLIALGAFTFLSMTAFANNEGKKKNKKEIPVKEKLEEVKKDPLTRERAAHADVYIIKKEKGIQIKK
jgi:hypothetical protein